MTEPGGQPILSFERLFVDFELKSLFKRAWLLREIQLDGPVVHAVIQKEGVLNLAHLLPPSDAKRPTKDQAHSQPPRLICANIRIADGQLSFMDQRPNEPAAITLAPLNAGFTNLTTLPSKEGGMT